MVTGPVELRSNTNRKTLTEGDREHEDMNTIQLTGRLTKDPELVDDDQVTVCRMRLAVDRMGRGDETGYIDVATFGNPGRACAAILTKGWLVAVEGRLDYSEWTTRDDQRREGHSVVGHVEFLAAPKPGDDGANDAPAGSNEDIPF